jgi:bifunctional DNA-binding transcriptional regulator/antitoxin component of YhaV-PrlF toxin-antitoxin module
MSQLITITSKRQLTIPAAIFKKLKLKKGQRLLWEK